MSVNAVYICPTDKSLQCSWKGSAEDIMDHFIQEHEDLLLHSSEIDIDLRISSENRLLFLNEEIFLIQLKIENKFLRIGLRYLGPKRIADSIYYDIVIKVDDQSYFPDYFGSGPSIFEITDGFWTINLDYLRFLHVDLTSVQCNFSISTKPELAVEDFGAVSVENNADDVEVVEGSSNENTVIDDDEIDEILNDDLELRSSRDKSKDEDALDNMSALNFSLLESSNRYCRRYSSFMGIPEELFSEKVKTDLSCGNCFINMLPPIYLCVNGHNICAECRYESCKICYGTVTENRNKDLEDYSRKCLHLCRYHQEGCMESFMFNEIRNHEIKCSFCVYRCMQDCSFKGKFVEFYSHFRIKHPSCKVFYATPVDFPRNSEFFVCDNRLGIFHCTSVLAKNSVRWIVVFLGPRDRNYSCELTFKGDKTKNVLFLKRLEDQYSIAQSKEDLKKMKVKDKNAVLTITGYFQ
ncbi:uncharacterized protein LOC123315002 [Coccinella septempunctata]|uniref:uncharacterized protein LOC123315002 n=1 Tax=Coccinella septempunctata TaxID=41139 RepID=UPI001D075009|nr:uncharacterized protein LOC123315002 [Coccinella septempunctata]